MPIFTVVDDPDNPLPMQHPGITLVDADGGPYNPATSIPDGTYADNLQLARDPELLLVGPLTRDPATQAVIAGTVAWRDGATGTYVGTLSTTFPGSTDSYVLTHVLGGVGTTYTQPLMTRNASGAVTNRPALVVS